MPAEADAAGWASAADGAAQANSAALASPDMTFQKHPTPSLNSRSILIAVSRHALQMRRQLGHA